MHPPQQYICTVFFSCMCEMMLHFVDMFVHMLQKMPDTLMYDVCYLNRNAGIILSRQDSSVMIDTIKLMQGSYIEDYTSYYDDVYNITVDILNKVLADMVKILQSFTTVILLYYNLSLTS